MKKYVGIKVIEAERMDYHTAGKAGLIRDYDPNVENTHGYHVVYEDGYESWSPEITFEKHYKPIEDSEFDFGTAIRLLKLGYKVARAGWNGKGMWLVYVPGTEIEVKEGTPYWNAGLRGKLKIDGHIDMYTAQKTIQPGWLASQADIQAEDWMIV